MHVLAYLRPFVGKVSLMRMYVITMAMATSVFVLQSRHLHFKRYVYQSTIYKTTWNFQLKIDDILQKAGLQQTTPSLVRHGILIDPRWTKNGLLYELPLRNVSVLSAVGRNSTRKGFFSEIILNGWEGRTHLNDSFSCCLYYEKGIVQVNVTSKNHWLQCKKVPYIATQYRCPNVRSHLGLRPKNISLVPAFKKCPQRESNGIPVLYPSLQPPGTIAICSKITYGSVSPTRLIEWFEVQRNMGVSKIITFTYNISKTALKVLQYYQSIGLVDLYPYDFPHKDAVVRDVGVKIAQAFNDEQVALFDCMEKLTGYSLVGVLDIDEFLIPTPIGFPTWQNLFNVLLRQHTTAAGFSFRTEMFVSNWRNSSDGGEKSITQFTHRTGPMWDRQKNVFIPDRVVPGSIWTHNYTAADGYQQVNISSNYATIKHYRSCRKEWIPGDICYKKRRYRDHRLINLVKSINETIRKTQYIVGVR